MKLVVIMSIQESTNMLRKLLTENNVLVFSELEMKGFKRFPMPDKRDNWFAHDQNETYSHLVFTVVESEKADELIEAIRRQLQGVDNLNPVHAFVTNVEQFL